MAPKTTVVQAHTVQVQSSSGGPLRVSIDHPDTPLLFQVLSPRNGGDGCPDHKMAQRTTIWFSSHSSDTQADQKNKGDASGNNSCGPILAKETVVLRAAGNICQKPSSSTGSTGHAVPGSSLAPHLDPGWFCLTSWKLKGSVSSV